MAVGVCGGGGNAAGGGCAARLGDFLVLAGEEEGGSGQIRSLAGLGMDLVSRAYCHLEKNIKAKNADNIADERKCRGCTTSCGRLLQFCSE